MTDTGGTLAGRRIVVGVAGSIAAYKAVTLVRLLIERGAVVDVAMTPSATRFVGPLTFAALSRHVKGGVAAEATAGTGDEGDRGGGIRGHVGFLSLEWEDAQHRPPSRARVAGISRRLARSSRTMPGTARKR